MLITSLKVDIRQGYGGQPQMSNGASKAPMVSPNYREEAERIVAEEKAQGEKIPTYEVGNSLWHLRYAHPCSGLGGLQVSGEDGRRRVLQCLQSYRTEDRAQDCGEGRSQVRIELVTGEVHFLVSVSRSMERIFP